MNLKSIIFLLITGLFLLTACSEDDGGVAPSEVGASQILFVHTIPALVDYSGAARTEVIPWILPLRQPDAISYGQSTGYIEYGAGEGLDIRFRIDLRDDPDRPFDHQSRTRVLTDIEFDKSYTFIGAGFGNNLYPALFFEDDLTPPAAGNAHLRLVHGSVDSPDIDILIDGVAVTEFSSMAYGSGSVFVPLTAGSKNITVNEAGTSNTLLTKSIDLANETIYTAIISGLSSITGFEPLDATIITHN